MFDIAWTEILVIAVVAILVVGPRDLPRMLRNLGNFMGQMRRMAGDFQKQFNDALREAELDEVRHGIESVRKASPASQLRNSLNPLKEAGDSVRKAIEDPGAPKAAASQAQSSGAAKPEPAGEAGTTAAAKPEPEATAAKPAAATKPEAEAAKPGAAKPKAAPKSKSAAPGKKVTATAPSSSSRRPKAKASSGKAAAAKPAAKSTG